MTIHLLKLCVGCDTVQDLKDWQDERLKQLKRAGKTPELCHRTLQAPRRREEVLDGGSLYWVIKGVDPRASAHSSISGQTRKDDGIACCGIVLDRELVATRAQARRAFQGLALSACRRRAGGSPRGRRRRGRHAEGHARRFARASPYRFLGAVGKLSISRVVPRNAAPITRAGPLIGPNSGASVSGSRTAT